MDLPEKLSRYGIEASFIDGNGQTHTIDEQTFHHVAEALGPAPPRATPIVMRCVDGVGIDSLVARLSHLHDWKVFDADDRLILSSADARSYARRLPFGVYRLRGHDEAAENSLIVAPERAYEGEFDRRWLLAVQLYGIRSRGNWGIGDFSDLQALLRWAANLGAAGVGLNPLHALFDDEAEDCSPYSPNSRLFLNSIYIDVAALPELPEHFVAENRAEIERLRNSELVDYAGVAALKQCGLRLAFAQFKTRTTLKRKSAFDAFRKQRGRTLWRFACFEALRQKYRSAWWEWPEPWRRPDDEALSQFRRSDDADEIAFAEFVQWCAHEQLQACVALGEELGLPVGLYLDIAVGVKSGGFDAWNEQAAISRRLSVGAPPDQLNTAGQDWGLAGFNTSGLEARAFAPFRDMLSASMRYAGAVRLDHVLGLNRIYVVPSGFPPDCGVYIRMPFEAMLANVAIESAAHRCIMIGEDLGTVPDGFRERLADWAIWSYRVMIFERGAGGVFNAPDSYPAHALVTFSTHDLATFAGWRSGHDIALKQSLQIDPGENIGDREHAVHQLDVMLGGQLHGRDGFKLVLSYLAQTPSRLLGVAIEDLLGIADQANVPGTTVQHPNWRRKLPLPFEVWDDAIDVDRLREALRLRIVSR
ncbi:4-alpha-glucanotransferase [Afipia felis]|uniref:4-alpha-glucanotransferase n=2 Tax=Afipia felis TaxID=1035 RepID=A0A380WB52_AFIFE|nr:4-alpha-glucanotransferase [Afipia felis]EKS29097.1 4-alpha-glucanotransferase [Afipia felis ATCC 53690]SUU77804.1 4-alpha-glucanotransferase [Afipia felis]SUU85869.1 4-alpha-glucanotransferase [Afipia felis]